jgi:steroid delta-isomerase-like uncharacterized protein
MTLAENKALVRRFIEEFWNQGNLAAADDLMSPDVVIHEPVAGAVGDLKAFNASIRAAFPDWRATVDEMVAEGDCVAERWTGRGTHNGAMQEIPATGRQVAVPGAVFYRIEGGKIVEFRGQFDRMSLMRQLGVISESTTPGR